MMGQAVCSQTEEDRGQTWSIYRTPNGYISNAPVNVIPHTPLWAIGQTMRITGFDWREWPYNWEFEVKLIFSDLPPFFYKSDLITGSAQL